MVEVLDDLDYVDQKEADLELLLQLFVDFVVSQHHHEAFEHGVDRVEGADLCDGDAFVPLLRLLQRVVAVCEYLLAEGHDVLSEVLYHEIAGHGEGAEQEDCLFVQISEVLGSSDPLAILVNHLAAILALRVWLDGLLRWNALASFDYPEQDISEHFHGAWVLQHAVRWRLNNFARSSGWGLRVASDYVFEVLLGVDEVDDHEERSNDDSSDLGVDDAFRCGALHPFLMLLQRLLQITDQLLHFTRLKLVNFNLLLDHELLQIDDAVFDYLEVWFGAEGPDLLLNVVLGLKSASASDRGPAHSSRRTASPSLIVTRLFRREQVESSFLTVVDHFLADFLSFVGNHVVLAALE